MVGTGVLRLLRRIGVWAFVFSTVVGSASAAEPCAPLVGTLVSVEGLVELQRDGTLVWQRASPDESLCRADTIRVGPRSRAAVSLINDAVLRIDQDTTLRLLDVGEREEERSFLDLVLGAFQSFSRKPRTLAVNTPYLNATIEGTEFLVRVAADRTQVTVFEGRVAAENDFGRLVLAQGESAAALAGRPPQARTLVKPRDAVQWALYYPPVLAVLGGQTERIPSGLPTALAEAIRLAGGGDAAGAFAALERVPTASRDARFHLYRAALSLSVGRIDEARSDIDRALAQDPGAGLGFALRAVIKVVQNEREQALTDAARAVELSPRTAAAKIALSYAQQANFQLEPARDTLLRAVEEQPEDALAWARLGELWLSLGYRGRALEAAERAAGLAPDLQRAQIVLGFAALAQFRIERAEAAFERGIALNSADPLPQLGLGLTKIRRSDLAEGRKDIEVAVGLDSGNALLRAYLGKAYFEEKRAPLDAEQFAIAKTLDPFDPTPYLYDAIRKQSENKPGEALQDLQASIERNDNRAIFRGRLQLDQDRASRGSSLARIYDDLGFKQLGVNEAAKSIALDPANASAHRFLSDTYRGIRRREIARVSELLQAQLMQDINVNPVQPSISETNLNIITRGGPAEAGFNEFTPLFERNQVQLNGTALAGNDDTFGGEGVVTGLYDWFSISAGVFHYETDGFRENHDIEHDIYNLYAQAAITPELNVQAEIRRRDTDNGDIELNFDPNVFLERKKRELDEDTGRVGLRWSPTPSSDALVSFIYSDRDAETTSTELFPFPFLDVKTDTQTDSDSYQGEAQYLYRRDPFNLTAGFAVNDVDVDLESSSVIVSGPFTGFVVNTLELDSDIRHYHGYLYSNINLPAAVTWTVGVGVDDYHHDAHNRTDGVKFDLDVEKVSPKLGVQWNITQDLRLRGAVFRTVKPVLAANRFIGPTQVAGFNQFFDDANGTASWRYGGGIDWRLTDNFFVGAEGTWRKFDQPVVDTINNDFVLEDRDETLHRVYLYWTPIPELALSGEFNYDLYESERGLVADLPEEVETFSVPLSARYFDPSGFFASLGATFVDQDVDRRNGSTLPDGDDQFVVVDAAIGWRLPRRLGIVSLEVANLLNTDFNYQDDSYREFSDEPYIGPFIPERTILGRLTLNF